MKRVLAIESSCDETSASILEGTTVLSNIIKSQIETHARYGGVVPELAAAGHLYAIRSVVEHSLSQANTTLDKIDAVAVTNKPGLAGALLVGLCFAKSIAVALKKPLIGVDHLEGHIYSACIEHKVEFPFICLTVSGGHTALYLVHDFRTYERIGHTMDDACGEAFDKVAKLLHLPYPGGPVIEKLAASVNFEDYFNYPRGKKDTFLFSFSGLKTAVLYHLIEIGAYSQLQKRFLLADDSPLKAQVASSMLVCIGDMLAAKIDRALLAYPQAKSVCFVGGVACNKYLRARLTETATNHSKPLYYPSLQYCTDNAAMIGFVGQHKLAHNEISSYRLDVLE